MTTAEGDLSVTITLMVNLSFTIILVVHRARSDSSVVSLLSLEPRTIAGQRETEFRDRIIPHLKLFPNQFPCLATA